MRFLILENPISKRTKSGCRALLRCVPAMAVLGEYVAVMGCSLCLVPFGRFYGLFGLFVLPSLPTPHLGLISVIGIHQVI